MTSRLRGLILSVALLSAGATALTAGSVQAQSEKGAVLGFVTELSGPASLFGEAALQGAQLAVDEVNAAGGVLGGRWN